MEQENKTNELKEVTKEIIGWEDNRLFRTIKSLTINPGKVISEYCKGEKQKYLSPVIYFFGVTAIETYIASASGLYDLMLKEKLESIRKSLSDSKLNIDASSAVDRMNTAFSFFFGEIGQKMIIIPLLLILTWLFYRKHNKSFKENSWFALYTLGHATLLSIPLMAIWYVTSDMLVFTAFSFIIPLVYWIWASRQFYKLKLGRAILLRLVMFAVAMLTIGALSSLMVSLTILSAKR